MSSLGKNFRITIFGASHGEAIGVVMEGLPVGFAIDMDALNAFLTRRAPGRGAFATARRESDAPLFLSGVKNGVTCGGAVTAVIRNGDAHPGDYDALRNTPRPGHAGLCRPHERRRCRRSLRRRTLFRTAHRAALRCGRHRHAASGGGKHPHRFAHRLHCRYRGRGHLPGVHAGKTVPDAQRSARRGDARCHCKGTRRRRQRRRRGGVRGGSVCPQASATRFLTVWRAVSPQRSSVFRL